MAKSGYSAEGMRQRCNFGPQAVNRTRRHRFEIGGGEGGDTVAATSHRTQAPSEQTIVDAYAHVFPPRRRRRRNDRGTRDGAERAGTVALTERLVAVRVAG